MLCIGLYEVRMICKMLNDLHVTVKINCQPEGKKKKQVVLAVKDNN